MNKAQELIVTGQNMIKSGLVKGTWGNVSTRTDNTMWITPSGISYDEFKEENIAIVDVSTGTQVGGNKKPSSEMPLHLMLYRNLSNINGIVHTHSIYASVFAAIGEEIPCYTEDQAQIIGGSIPVAKYAFPGTEKLGNNVLSVFQMDRFSSLMANHGLVSIGRSLKEAWTAAEVAEKSAQVAAVIKSMGKNPLTINETDIKEMRKIYLESYSLQNT